MSLGKILVVDDDKDVLKTAEMFLKRKDFEVQTEPDPSNIPRLLSMNNFDLVLLDMNFRKGDNSGTDGLRWLKRILDLSPNIGVVLITAYSEVNLAVEAMKKGATDFVSKPWKNEKLLATIQSALQLRREKLKVARLKETNEKLTANIEQSYRKIIGESPALQKVFDVIEKVAETDANVLVLGENGTGKELVAREIHKNSHRSDKVFISVDLGAISETLFESELFGHVRGAFTDAVEDKTGSIELSHGGTLFLDEIGNLSLTLQAKLLTVLQQRKIKRVGGQKEIDVDFRLICATNMSLYKMVEESSFRQDLLFRVNTVEITIPPLRQRIEDIPLLMDHFVAHYAQKYKKSPLNCANKTLKHLQKYSWPGNVRELQHAAERAVILCDGKQIAPDDFFIKESKPMAEVDNNDKLTLDEMEKRFILKTLDENKGNVTNTAKQLGVTRSALYRRLNKYGI